MSKVICDVCGTTYPETASRCPICGCAKSDSMQTAAGASAAETGASYRHVRGGRFSKSNVRRRTQSGKQPPRKAAAVPVKSEKSSREKSNDKPLIIAIILLLVAILLVATYMIIDYTAGKNGGKTDDGKGSQSAVPCTAIKLSETQIKFEALEGCQWLLEVTKIPSNTTDEVKMTIADTSIATFDATGRIIPVAAGETTVRVTCGQAVAECKIVCEISGQGTEPPTTEPPETQPPAVTPEPEFEFRFNTKYVDDNGVYDVTLAGEKTWRAYRSDMTVSPSDIKWTSDNTSVCTVKGGIVTVVGKGETLIHAEYNGKRVSCKIRVTVAPASSSSSGYTISHTDVTLESVGEAFNLFLKDSHGENQTVTWKASADGYVTISGNKITAAKSTSDLADNLVKVSCDYQGSTYTCIVRIN